MNILRSFVLIVLTSIVFKVEANDAHSKSDRAYAIMIEAGAKLLEFDIVRENLKMQEKKIVATLNKRDFASESLATLISLEKLARGYEKIVHVFIGLQRDLENDLQMDRARKRAALNGLIVFLETPEALHMLLPPAKAVGDGYKHVMTYAPTTIFIKAVQKIAHHQFFLHYCDEENNAKIFDVQKLTPEAYLFYDIIKQTVINVFADTLQEFRAEDTDEATCFKDGNASSQKVESSLHNINRTMYIDLNIVFNPRLGSIVGSVEWADLQEHINEIKRNYEEQIAGCQKEIDWIDKIYKEDLVKIKRNYGHYNSANYMSSPHKIEQEQVDKRTERYERECEAAAAKKLKLEETRNSEIKALEQAQMAVRGKLAPIAHAIAKSFGASVVEATNGAFYVDPELDIIQTAVEQLNKEYLVSK